ncbi:hypothetical protein [Burkholderia ambifaria]|jgi:hypothetical protein|uniref:hypothetical protein n=1 Tax=Burkholderia ambifaria TaxID=152480 RepID=UPI0015889D1F|nr:hypothetical protein [Burkholderia ambifaria]
MIRRKSLHDVGRLQLQRGRHTACTAHAFGAVGVHPMRMSSREYVDRTDHIVVIIGAPAPDTTERGLS